MVAFLLKLGKMFGILGESNRGKADINVQIDNTLFVFNF
jgi:hypothetical protein